MTPLSTPARIERIIACFASGKNSMMRPTVSAASTVCRVESTRCPDSAAWRAVWAVSASRSSPTRITSGSWRSARRSACGNVAGVEPDLALVDDAAVVGVQDLDRVLDRDDVLAARPVDVVEHRGERGRLPRAGRAGREHEAAVLLGEASNAGRQRELARSRDLLRDHPECERDRAALAEAVDAEAGQVAALVRDVEVAELAEVARQLGSRAVTRRSTESRSSSLRFADVERRQSPVMAQDRRPPDLQVDVGGAGVDGALEEGVEIHRDISPIGSVAARLETTHPNVSAAPTSRGRSGGRCGAAEAVQRLERDPPQAARPGGSRRSLRTIRATIGQVPARAPAQKRAAESGRARARRPRRGVHRAERAPPGGVRVEVARDDRRGCEPRTHACLVDTVARKRIDETGCVADEQDVVAPQRRAGATHREPVAADVRELTAPDAVHRAEPFQVGAEAAAPPTPTRRRRS